MYKETLKKHLSALLGAAITVSAISAPLAYADTEKTTVKNPAVIVSNDISADDYTLPGGTVTDDDKDYSEDTDKESETETDKSQKQDDSAEDNNEYTLPGGIGGNTTGTPDKTEKDNGKVEFDIPAGAMTSTEVIIDFKMMPRMQVIDSFAAVELYTKSGKKLGEASEWVGGITENISFTFNVPQYALGETFVLKLKDGLSYIKYYDKAYGKGEAIELKTYYYKDENGNDVYGNGFSFDGCPMFEHAIVLYIEGRMQNLNPKARLVDSTAMIPLRAAAEQLGFEVRYDEKYNSVVCTIGDKQILFNVGHNYVTVFGQDQNMSHNCTMIDHSVFVPARSFAEIVGSEIEAIDFGDHIDVCIGKSSKVSEYMDSIPVNKWGISSRTNYLVWIDKSDFKVRVYTGSQYKWKPVASFSCAIGAPNTPTITGSFEYEYKMQGWYYDGYYVGPCLVFYGNYAMHSTLLRYDNVPYDNRVGVMISHGCVRLHKSDIDWIASHLPLNSRVYITE